MYEAFLGFMAVLNVLGVLILAFKLAIEIMGGFRQ